jgi:PD-(D/E)XK nuclease superfamily protein
MGRRRTWTDDDLIAAVHASCSWSQVVRTIGLAKGSSAFRTVQGHAARLGLAVSHLPTPGVTVKPARSVPDLDNEALADAIRKSNSWAAVLRELGLDASGTTYKRVQCAAAALAIDTAHFTGQAWAAGPVEAVAVPFINRQDDSNLRRAGVAIATAWFMYRGYVVSIPIELTRYDLVVESDTSFARVQVKSTTIKERGRWTVRIARRKYDAETAMNAGGRRISSPYLPGEIDFFFIVTGGGEQYLIPLSATNGATKLTLDSKYAGYKVT